MPVVTNPKTRESRLFSSTRQHIFRSAAAIVRSFVMYRPYVIFGLAALLFALVGLLPFIRYAVLVAMGEGGGHLQSLLVGAVLLILSFLCVMLGVLADLIRTNRTLLEVTLEHTKRTRYIRAPGGLAHVATASETGAQPLGDVLVSTKLPGVHTV